MRKALQDGTDKPLDEVCKEGVPEFIYEPNVRYKRIETPDYKRSRNYSIAGTLTGTGLLATGLASFNYALAYAGAALALTSLGYQSGNWRRVGVRSILLASPSFPVTELGSGLFC